VYLLHKTGGRSRHFQRLPGDSGVVQEFFPGSNFTGTFTGTCLLLFLQPVAFEQLRIGGEGRNRPDFPAVAPQICLISLGIQAKTVLSDRIVFNPFGVRFGVRYNYFSARR
jgi:hypothetical protein